MYLNDYYDYPNAYSSAVKAQKIADKHGSSASLSSTYLSLGTIAKYQNLLKDIHDNHEIVVLFKKAFYAAWKNGNYQNVKSAFFNLMLAMVGFDEDEYIKHEMDMIVYELPDSVSWKNYAVCLIDGVRLLNKKDMIAAEKRFRQFRGMAETVTTLAERPSAMISANIYLFLCVVNNADRQQTALSLLLENLDIAKQNGVDSYLIDAYNNLSTFYASKNDDTKKREYHLLALEAKDSLNLKHKLVAVEKMQFLNQIKEKSDEMAELSRRKEMQRRVMNVSIFFSAALMIMLVLLFIKFSQVSKRNRMLYSNIQQMLEEEQQNRKLMAELQELKMSQPAEKSATQTGNITDSEKQDIVHRVFYVMETDKAVYGKDFSIAMLADMVEAKEYKVSYTINDRTGQNFYNFLVSIE